jgi:glycosyltransferase involved in cell wall biosynthesis
MAEKRHIAYLCLQATIEGQASHAHVHEIIRGLGRLGYVADLYEPRYAKTGKEPGALGRLLEFRRLHRHLAPELASYDALYVRAHPLASASAKRAQSMGIPVVQECNGKYDDFTAAWPAATPFGPLLADMAREQYRRADAVIAVSDGLAEWIRAETGRMDVHVIPNAADVDRFRPGLPNPTGTPERYALYFGVLAPWQGIDIILAATRTPEWPDGLPLVVAGDGPLRAAVQAARDADPTSVVYLGSIGYDKVPPLLSNALMSLLVMRDANRSPSPMKLYETLAAGVPLVAVDAPHVARFVAQSGAGIVLDRPDAHELARAVAAIATHPTSAAKMGNCARALAVAKHSWAARAADTAAVIEDAIARKRGSA